MNNDYLSIGEMAKMNHITVTTLRLYDELDLLKPVYVNPETNYRYYDIKQNARLDLIQYMKELQMNLKEIKELLDKEDINLIEAILIKKKQQLSIQINDLQRTKDAISRTIYSLERYRKSPPSGTITLEYIDRRRIYVMHTNINFYEHDLNVTIEHKNCSSKKYLIWTNEKIEVHPEKYNQMIIDELEDIKKGNLRIYDNDGKEIFLM